MEDCLLSVYFLCSDVLPKAGNGVLDLKAEGLTLTVACGSAWRFEMKHWS